MNRSLLIALVFAAPAFGEDLAEVNKPAPTFRLPVYNPKEFGEPSVAIDTYTGFEATDKKAKLLVVSFMASFCGPCKKEMPYLQTLHEKHKDAGLRIMMVAIDTDAEGQAKVDELIALNKVTFPVAKDRFNIVARRWLGTQSPLPSLFFVKPDGTISSVHRGYSQDGAEVLAQEIGQALGVKVDKPVVVAPEKPVEPVAAPVEPVKPEPPPKKKSSKKTKTK
jgi:thiol-disulfide isomerase/thioredoxin